jgi:hypothetical protein
MPRPPAGTRDGRDVTLAVLPGDVLVVHDHDVWAWLIRFGPQLHDALYGDDQPTHWNHVLVVMPTDEHGRRWAIEGRPGGVGWRDLDAAGYLEDPQTLSNVDQPKSDAQRDIVCDTMEALAARHVPYDWPAIAMEVVREVAPMWGWNDAWGQGAPTGLICSSAADLACQKAGLKTPAYARYCAPWDWAAFDQRKAWAA